MVLIFALISGAVSGALTLSLAGRPVPTCESVASFLLSTTNQIQALR